MSSSMATTTTTTGDGVESCSLCVTQASLPPDKEVYLMPTYLRQLVNLVGFNVAFPLCSGCLRDVILVIDTIRNIKRMHNSLHRSVEDIKHKRKVATDLATPTTKKKKVKTDLATPVSTGVEDTVPMSAEPTPWIISPLPEVKMEQEEIEEWITPEVSSEGKNMSSNVTSISPTMEDFLAPFAPAGTMSISQEDNIKQEPDGDQDQDPDIIGDDDDDTESSPDEDDDDEVSPPPEPPAHIKPSISAVTCIPFKPRQKRPFPSGGLISTLSINPPLFQCNVCMKKFKTKNNIQYHEFCGNEGRKPFKCRQCRKGFISKSHYEYHLRTHSGEKPYPCSKCDKSFNQKSQLTRHTRAVHDGEKLVRKKPEGGKKRSRRKKRDKEEPILPFTCDKCGTVFANKQTLQIHDLTHTGERGRIPAGKEFPLRAHACDQCTRSFHTRKDLVRHLLTHTDEYPFKCEICSEKFRRKDNLQRHLRTTHKGEVESYLAKEAQTKSPVPEAKIDSGKFEIHSSVVKIEEFLPKTEVESDVEDDPLLFSA